MGSAWVAVLLVNTAVMVPPAVGDRFTALLTMLLKVQWSAVMLTVEPDRASAVMPEALPVPDSGEFEIVVLVKVIFDVPELLVMNQLCASLLLSNVTGIGEAKVLPMFHVPLGFWMLAASFWLAQKFLTSLLVKVKPFTPKALRLLSFDVPLPPSRNMRSSNTVVAPLK